MSSASAGGEEALDKLVDFVANHDFVSGEEKNVEAIRAEALGLAPLPPDDRHLNYVPNIPSCDFCGKPEAGRHHCSRCEWYRWHRSFILFGLKCCVWVCGLRVEEYVPACVSGLGRKILSWSFF